MTFNILKNKRKKKIKIAIKTKFMYYVIKTKKTLIVIIFSVVSNLNKKKYEIKNEQIIKKTLFQRIYNILLKLKK